MQPLNEHKLNFPHSFASCIYSTRCFNVYDEWFHWTRLVGVFSPLCEQIASKLHFTQRYNWHTGKNQHSLCVFVVVAIKAMKLLFDSLPLETDCLGRWKCSKLWQTGETGTQKIRMKWNDDKKIENEEILGAPMMVIATKIAFPSPEQYTTEFVLAIRSVVFISTNNYLMYKISNSFSAHNKIDGYLGREGKGMHWKRRDLLLSYISNR